MPATDAEGRCHHWHGDDDVLWLRLACCREFYPCRDCHDEEAGHAGRTWPLGSDDVALCCGRCGHAFRIQAYLAAPDACPGCQGPFNPRCRHHHHRYFDGVERPMTTEA